MDEIHVAKQIFTHTHLRNMVCDATDDDVRTLVYEVQGNDEIVRIVFGNGYERRVCVTGDSKKALAIDVLNAL